MKTHARYGDEKGLSAVRVFGALVCRLAFLSSFWVSSSSEGHGT